MDDSPFGNLPAEVRNNIYSLVIHEDGVAPTFNIYSKEPYIRTSPPLPQILALTMVCKQMRNECCSMAHSSTAYTVGRTFGHLYAAKRNTATPSTTDGVSKEFELWQETCWDWLFQIGDSNRSLVRKINIGIGRWDSDGYPRYDHHGLVDSDVSKGLAKFATYVATTENTGCEVTAMYPGEVSQMEFRMSYSDQTSWFRAPAERFRVESRKLNQAWKEGSLMNQHFVRQHMDLQQCRACMYILLEYVDSIIDQVTDGLEEAAARVATRAMPAMRTTKLG